MSDSDLPPIEENIPLPETGYQSVRGNKYGLERLREGQSIVVDLDQVERLRSSANNYRMQHSAEGWRYKTVRVDTPTGPRIRLWRLKNRKVGERDDVV